jgi:hypothetical protein
MPAANTKSESKPERIEQHSQLLDLPPEIRLSIYAFALHHAVDEIRETGLHSPRSFPPQRPAMRGAIALLHTSSLLRSESRQTLSFLVELERFQVQRSYGWVEFVGLVDWGNRKGWMSEIVGKRDFVGDVRWMVERFCQALREAGSE